MSIITLCKVDFTSRSKLSSKSNLFFCIIKRKNICNTAVICNI